MLDNLVTFVVNSVDTIFTRIDEFANRSVYKSPDHSLVSKDLMTVYRTPPTKSGNFLGTAKTAVKFHRDSAVTGVDSTTTVQAAEIGSISFSLPVGTTTAEALALRHRMIAVLSHSDFIVRLSEELEV